MSKIDVKQRIRDLEIARQLIERAFEDLKNVDAFRDHEGFANKFATRLVYTQVMLGVADLLQAARAAE